MLMAMFSGYENIFEIHNGANSRVYRARRLADDRSVILKVLKAEYPTVEQLRRYRQEYHLTQHLQLANVIKAYELTKWQRTLVIVFEDFGGLSLSQWVRSHPQGLPIALFLSVAIKITRALAQLHSQGVIHKDINPANIVLNPETMTLKLIDLGISTPLSRETPALEPPSVLEGTLAYLSPEQTGRMNRMLDYRTDFYSLGVTFYELLSGRLPFVSNDPMELVHCHIAKQPHSLLNLRPGEIPSVLAAIVSRLMAKNAEDRYQSAWGLTADLEDCAAQWEQTATLDCEISEGGISEGGISERIHPFPLGRQDLSDQLRIPQTLYGRERETAILQAAFEQVAERGRAIEWTDDPLPPPHPSISPSSHLPTSPPTLILVTGYSGIGKSALVRSLYPAITASRGSFIAGKFDQFQRHTPYSAIVAAFAALVKQLLGESDSVLQGWRSRLLAALGSNGQVVIDVIPDVVLIIGPQPPVPELGTSETQNRFNLVFQRFIQALCTPEHPLVLFLDDMQWADLATLNLLERLAESPIHHLLIIAAYRDNEVPSSHPLALTIAQLRQRGANLTQITVEPLLLEQLAELIADTLHEVPATVSDLAELVRRKTGGNPFFINQFLHTLHQEKLLTLNGGLGQWQWDLAQIEAIGFTDNVVELMVSQLQKLPHSVQTALSTAAYLGTAFDLQTLSLIQNRAPAAIFADLTLAIERGLVVGRSPLDENLLIQDYQFGHDRIQQAAYSLIPSDLEQVTHLRIGRLLLAQSRFQDAGRLFDTINHLNIALSLIQERAERERLAQLNLQAAQKARASTAYAAALNYAQTGIQLLGTLGWHRQYKLTLALHETLTEAACLTGDRETVLALVRVVFNHAQDPLDRGKTYETLIHFHVAQKQHLAAITCGLEFLHALQIKLPAHPSRRVLLQVLLKTKIALRGKSNAVLLSLPEIQNAEKLAVLRILNLLMIPAYFASPHLMVVLATTGIAITLRYGNSPWAASFYTTYGIVLSSLGDLRQSYQFGKLALALGDRFTNLAVIATIKTAVPWHCQPWQEPLHTLLPVVEDGIKAALNSGNLLFLGIGAYMSVAIRLDLGMPIDEYIDKIPIVKDLIAYSGDKNSKLLLDIYCWGIFNLQHPVDQPALLAADPEAERALIAQFQAQDDMAALSGLYGFKTFLAYLFGDYAAAIEYADAQLPYEAALKGGYVIVYLWFYDSLTRLAAYPRADAATQKRLLQQVISNQRNLWKYAQVMPANFQFKYDLVEAEKCRILGDFPDAMDLYEQAIARARNSSSAREESLANELAAKFYLGWGKETIARVYMTEARYAYSRWGAIAKVQQLENQYPHLLEPSAGASAAISLPSLYLHSDRRRGADLDIVTLLKASRAIASEIVLDRLLQTLMQILLENAGAQAGCLLLPVFPAAASETLTPPAPVGSIPNFTIAIHSHAEAAAPASQPPLPQMLPESVLHYVARTHSSVVLDQTYAWGDFGQDPYLQTVKPLSVLCYPLVNQGELVGVVYLENRITAGVFTRDRIEFLQLLSGQMAIALVNAQLYAEKVDYTRTLEHKVAERTAALQAANEELLRLATFDNLTKIANRRRFDNYLTAEWQRHIREQQFLTLILMDIDYFKRYNDRYGHQCGDDCLIRVAQTLAQLLQRPTDLVARYGGEEFAAILPNTTLQGGLVVAEAMRAAIAALALPHAQSDVSPYVTLSVGVAALKPTNDLYAEVLIAHADDALYQAKGQGRNRVIAYTD